MIKFITEEVSSAQPTFGDVKSSQFFISFDGWLCQKINGGNFVSIATPKGCPCGVIMSGVKSHEPVSRILPHVTKIEF